jgi:hypothetical protein
MLMPAAIAVAAPAMKAACGSCCVQRDREDRRDRRERAVDQPGQGRLDALEQERLLAGHA